MTTPQQYPPQYPQPQYPYQQGPPPGGGRKALPWVIGGVVVVVAALVVTLVLTLGGDDDSGGDNTAAGGGEPGETYDLSTPEKAAESFLAAARAGDGEVLLSLTCIGHDGCVALLDEQPSTEELAEAKQLITSSADSLAEHMEGAEFDEATDASIPNGREVPYRTPDMGEDEYRAYMFLEFEGDWLWAGSAGGGSGSGGGGASPPTT